jgi:hypothetical protein
MMDNSKGLFASIHQPMKHSYTFLEFWSHENTYNVWFFLRRGTSSIKMHKWMLLAFLFKLIKTWHPLGHTFVGSFMILVLGGWKIQSYYIVAILPSTSASKWRIYIYHDLLFQDMHFGYSKSFSNYSCKP